MLDLEPQGTDEHGQDVFVGASQRQPHGRVFGGQVLGQTLVAAGRTVEAGRDVHSMHGYFLRAGDSDEPITFAVERLRDGRSFSARRVHAIQFGKPILSMIASFQDEAPGLDHQDEMPDVPDPDDLPTTADLLGHIDHPVARYWSRERPMDLRHVQAPLYWKADPERRARNAVWMRTPSAMPDDPVLHRAVLGYASDYTLLESVLRRHGVTWATPRAEGGQPGPRHVVAPAGAGRRVAALRPGESFGKWCTRARDRAYLQPGRAPGRLGRAGGDAAGARRKCWKRTVAEHEPPPNVWSATRLLKKLPRPADDQT